MRRNEALPLDRQEWPTYLGTWLYHILRLGLAAIFIYAGFIKLLDPRAFAHAIGQYQLLPDSLLPIVAVGLPLVELLAGLGLIFDRRGSLTAILLLLVMFTLILGYAILSDLDIDCGCFTLDDLVERDSVKSALYRDLVMIAATGFLFWRRRGRSRKLFNLTWQK